MTTTINASTSSGLVNTADTSGSLALQTAGTTGVYINSSQKVGINTTTTGTTATGDLTLYASGSDYGTTICLSDGGLGGWVQGSTSGSTSAFIGNFKYNPVTPASSYSPYTATGYGINMGANNGIQFFAANAGVSGGTFTPTERMRINSSGYFKQSSTGSYVFSGSSLNEFNSGANTSVLATANQAASGTIGGISSYFSAQAPNNTTSYFLECSDTVNQKCMIYSSGTVSNRTGTYNTISDAKLKENIVDATPKLDKLMDVKVRNYNLIGDDLKQIGFVAQELEQIFPALIDNVPDLDENKEPTGEVTKGVKLTVMIPILVKAIQELKAELDATKAEVAALKGTV